MEEVYLYKNTEYSEIERKQIIYLREAFSYKFGANTLFLRKQEQNSIS